MAATTASGAAECCPVIEFPSSSTLLRSQWPDLYAGIWVRQRTALNGFVEYYNRQTGLSLRKEIPPLNTAPVALQQQVQARWIIVSGCAAGVRCPWNLAPFGSISYGQLLMYMEDVQSTTSRNYLCPDQLPGPSLVSRWSVNLNVPFRNVFSLDNSVRGSAQSSSMQSSCAHTLHSQSSQQPSTSSLSPRLSPPSTLACSPLLLARLKCCARVRAASIRSEWMRAGY